jgi:ubiquinone/menaquinone biosynthesis C-methylase UbiE
MERSIMDTENKHRICPVEKAGLLDFALRKLVHNPRKILGPYIKEGMKVLDLGCGPGFFTLEMARLVGSSGKVLAADLQDGMLEKLKVKIQNTGLANRVEFHQCPADRIGLSEKCDFILVFYMLHEVPDPGAFLREIKALLKPDGKVLIAEPKWHVTHDEFLATIAVMEQAGFAVLEKPKICFSRAVVIGH